MPSTRLIVRGAPLPQSFKGDLNKLWFAMLDRLEVVSPFGEVQIQIGGLQPTSNKGPWFKDGQKIYVWDEPTKTYIPLDITDSLAPVTAAITTALIPYAKTADVTAAIAAAVAAIPPVVVNSAHFAANQSSDLTSGSLTNSGATVPIPFTTVVTDTEEGFGVGQYIVAKAGFYHISLVAHTGVSAGSATAISIVTSLKINGVGVRANSPGISVGGSAMFEVSYDAQLAVGDSISAEVQFTVTGGPITLVVVGNNTRLSGFLAP